MITCNFFIKSFILELCLLGSCYLGDSLLHHRVARKQYVAVLIDSLTHGIVGGISWAITCDVKEKHDILQCMLCLILSMAVDVDHFLAAKSFQLKAALSLPERPPFHSTTVVLLVDIILLVFSTILDLPSLILLCMIFTVAWISHHVRDAVRRGLWFYPFGSTPPLPKIVYIGIILMLPLVMGILFRKFYLKDKQNSITTSFETHAQIV